MGKLAKDVSEATTPDKRNSALIEFQNCIIQANANAMSAQAECASLIALNRELEEQVVKLKNWEAEAADYTLKQFGSGSFFYIYTPSVQTAKPRHLACVNCYQNRKIRILHILRNTKAGWPGWVCDECEAVVVPGGTPPSVIEVYNA